MKKDKSMKSAVAIMAHPDDEVLGCGATLSRLKREGYNTYVFILATGITSRGINNKKEIISLRNDAKLAAKSLGVSSIYFEDFPDNKMDTISLLEIVKKVEDFILRINPDIIFTHHDGDANVDHTITQKAVLIAARSLPKSKKKEIFASEILSSSEFGRSDKKIRADCYFQLENEDIKKALKALTFYKSEIRIFPHPRSIDAMQSYYKLRGAECGFHFAETFEVLKIVR